MPMPDSPAASTTSTQHMVASQRGSGSSRELQHPAAWRFFVQLLCCLRALQGAGWESLVKASRLRCRVHRSSHGH